MAVRHLVYGLSAAVIFAGHLSGCQAGGHMPAPPVQADGGNAATAAHVAPPADPAVDDSYDLSTAQFYADRVMRRQACLAQKRAAMREAETTAMIGGHVAAAAMMAGPGGRMAGKAIGVGTARVVRGQVQQLQADPC